MQCWRAVHAPCNSAQKFGILLTSPACPHGVPQARSQCRQPASTALAGCPHDMQHLALLSASGLPLCAASCSLWPVQLEEAPAEEEEER